MGYISKQQQMEFEAFQKDKAYGRILTPEGLKLVCDGFQNDPEAIGIHFLEVLAKFRRDGVL